MHQSPPLMYGRLLTRSLLPSSLSWPLVGDGSLQSVHQKTCPARVLCRVRRPFLISCRNIMYLNIYTYFNIKLFFKLMFYCHKIILSAFCLWRFFQEKKLKYYFQKNYKIKNYFEMYKRYYSQILYFLTSLGVRRLRS